MSKKYTIKFFIFCCIIPLACGGISCLLNKMDFSPYILLRKPPFSPPTIVFSIVWTLLYFAMGIATFLFVCTLDPHSPIGKSDCSPLTESAICTIAKKGLMFYSIQLAVNICWSPVFFRLHMHFLALVILVTLWYCVLQTYRIYQKINKASGILLLLYFIWCSYALYLNLGIVVLN